MLTSLGFPPEVADRGDCGGLAAVTPMLTVLKGAGEVPVSWVKCLHYEVYN